MFDIQDYGFLMTEVKVHSSFLPLVKEADQAINCHAKQICISEYTARPKRKIKDIT